MNPKSTISGRRAPFCHQCHFTDHRHFGRRSAVLKSAMSDEKTKPDALGEDRRLEILKDRLDAVHSAEEERNRSSGPVTDESYRLGNRVLAELIGGIGGGAFLGWIIDRFAGTSPKGLLGLMGLGIVASFVNILRMSMRKPD